MNVPDVVQAFSRMTEFSAVSASPIQFWLSVNPSRWKIGFRPSAAADAVEEARRARRGRSTGS